MTDVHRPNDNESVTGPLRRRLLYIVLLLALLATICVVSVVYWWSFLTVGRTLFPPESFSVGLHIDYDYDSVDFISEAESAATKAGVKLRANVDSTLKQNGFAKTESKGSREIVLYTGTFRGSPVIRLQLEDKSSTGEGGGSYRLSLDYSCQLSRSSQQYQDMMTGLMIEFDKELQSHGLIVATRHSYAIIRNFDDENSKRWAGCQLGK